ncbi:MAG: TonB-dependent receptor [Acidobacteria bacterium]|nr:TonB-dependent receptor [Acidobacteriota bacterium]
MYLRACHRTWPTLAGTWLFVLLALPVVAQTPTGVIDGVVRDPDSRQVPGVQVVANSPALIQKDLTVYSNQEGYYRLPLLPPGSYAVAFVLQGFQTIERMGLIVYTGQTTSVDVQLKLAALEESVTVVGNSPTVDSSSAKLGFNYTHELLDNVPTKRDFNSLAVTVPGVETASIYGTAPGALEQQNVLGAGPRANFFTFDGANVTDARLAVNQTDLFSYDIVEEVQVLKGAKPAEVGFAQGGFFQVVTKSGGNDFHGVVSTYYKGSDLQGDNITTELRQAGIRRSNNTVDAFDNSVSGGWRFLRDKLWWYGSARRQDQTLELLGFDQPAEDTVKAYLWKNTYQPQSKHRLIGSVNHWNEEVDPYFFGFAPSLAADRTAAMIRDRGGNAVNLGWNGIFTERLIVDAGFGYSTTRLNAFHQPGAGVAISDQITGARFRNSGIFSRDNPSINWDFRGSLSWFVPDAAGRHDLKVGVQHTYGDVPSRLDEIGDHLLRVSNGVPSQVVLLGTPATFGIDLNFTSAYAQDSWTTHGGRLTLNLGVRYDRIDAYQREAVTGGGAFANTALAVQYPVLKRQTTPGMDLLTWNSAAPRLAATWRFGERTVLRGSYSRYYHFLQTQQIPGSGVAAVSQLTFQWLDRNSDREYQVGEEGRLLRQSGASATTIDPDIRHPYADEVIIGVSRELFTDFSLNANFVYRRNDDLTNLVEIGIPFDTFRGVVVTDPGEDGRAGTGDEASLTVFAQDPATLGRNRQVLTNPSRRGFDNDQTYTGFELVANKRLSNRWQFVGSLVISKMEVTQLTGDTGVSALFQNPNNLINALGRDDLTDTYVVKMQGTYQAPYGIVVSGFYRWASGTRYQRDLVVPGLPQGVFTVMAEPRGTRENDPFNNLDLRAEKTLTLTQRMRLGLMLDAFNVFNASTVLQRGTRTAVDLGVPRALINPRILRLGARFTW